MPAEPAPSRSTAPEESRSEAGESSRRTLLIFIQTYVPDPTSIAPHMAHIATEMVRRGWRVIVYASARGYHDASVRYPLRETIDGVEVRRLPFTSFGKKSMLLRVVAGLSFMLQCTVRGALVRGVGAVLVTTAPLTSYAAYMVSLLRRAQLKFWVLDINPDQLVALGWLRGDGLPARLLETVNRAVLRQAHDVIALDHFMAERLANKVESPLNLHVIPPWPLEDHLEPVSHAQNLFRKEHGLEDRFVIMYSGNHGLTTPVSTILSAAVRLQHEERLLFVFVGGGYGKLEVERAIAEHGDGNIRSLPYQPLSRLKYSLSAADVHLVTMSDEVVGIIHPSKMYCAMEVERPLLAIGPRPSPLTELIERYRIGWCVANGDVGGTVRTIEEIVDCDPARLAKMGRIARQAIADNFGKRLICGQMADVIAQHDVTRGVTSYQP